MPMSVCSSLRPRCAPVRGRRRRAGADKVAPPVPRARATWVDTLPPVPTSYLDVPVRYDLAPAMHWLEIRGARVLRRSRGAATRCPDKKRLHYAYAADPEPFRLSVSGRTATLRPTSIYRVKAWYNPPVLPEISAKCGDDERSPARGSRSRRPSSSPAAGRSGPAPARSSPRSSNPRRDRCKVTFLRIDVTDKVMGAAQAALQRKLRGSTRGSRRSTCPGESRRLWDIARLAAQAHRQSLAGDQPLHRPHRHAPDAGRHAGHHRRPLRQPARHRRPAAGRRAPPPMPAPQDSTSRPPVLHLLTEGRLPYDVASSILTRELRGTIIKVAHQRLVLDSLHLIGVGDGRVAVGLAVHGSVRGVLYAVGRPAYDTATAAAVHAGPGVRRGDARPADRHAGLAGGRPDRGLPAHPGADQARPASWPTGATCWSRTSTATWPTASTSRWT